MEIEGIGLHTGQPAKVRFFAEEGPVRLRVGGQTFRPLASRVGDTTRCTVLEAEGVRLMTVEHLLAALYLRGIWEGLLIEVEGPEVPILDGSAEGWIAALEPFPARGPKPRPIPGPLRLQENKSLVSVEPAAVFSLNVTIAFPHPKIGYQSFASPPRALMEVSDARTFGFLAEVNALKAQGLIRGASLENALVFSECAPLNTPRGLDEPVRHKALDFLGDLYLAGAPWAGRFSVHRGSHRLHVQLAAQLERRLAGAGSDPGGSS
ncbi:UDP-3-O-[3-hydroxymyristoyl] N-acetylglucosamine deacetylase [Meiothermus sp. PNK-Is4]|nr:UDP-3-O-[3-hydroxymyristoyl] N-acetylglucosamine deacetylase [Meiothermus sp. Pnk-1]RYM36672.1 UDP-3-O-[3-hydroxymyristoyl] N-acetylglucosamine deacetylase [Meiothermus sp. PNK-Is4]